MPIDELEMAELYVRVFPEAGSKPAGNAEVVSSFSKPSLDLENEYALLTSILGKDRDIFLTLAKAFEAQGCVDLADVTAEISKFINDHNEELKDGNGPGYRVLKYVYSIV